MHSFPLLIASVLLCATTYAQPNFIPDVNLRNILNLGSPVVDEDGYLIDPDQNLGSLYIYTEPDLPPMDLTGLEYLLVTALELDNTQGGSFSAFPAFPRFSVPHNEEDFTYVRFRGFNGDEIPQLPENVQEFMIMHPVRIGQWTLSCFPDAIPTDVELTGFPETIPPPQVIEHIRQVTFSPWHQPVLSTTVGSDVDFFYIDQASNITSLDLSGYSSVELGIFNCEQLSSLTLPSNSMNAVVLQNLPALTTIQQIPPTAYIMLVNLTSLHSLEIVDCTQSLETIFTPIEVLSHWPTSVKTLSIQNAGLLDMTDLPDQLEELIVSESGGLSLPELPATLRVLDIITTPLPFLGTLPQNLETLRLQGNSLECVPVLPESLTSLMTDVPCIPNQPPLVPPHLLCTLLNTTCPGANPTVSGHIYVDTNENGIQDDGEPNAANITLAFSPSGHLTGTDQLGNYTVGLPVGIHSVSVVDGIMANGTVEPDQQTVSLPALGAAAIGVDFRIIPPPPPPTDLSIRLRSPGNPPRPGFEHKVTVMSEVISYAVPTTTTITIDGLCTILGTSFPTMSITNNVIVAEGLTPGVAHEVRLYTPPSVPIGAVL